RSRGICDGGVLPPPETMTATSNPLDLAYSRPALMAAPTPRLFPCLITTAPAPSAYSAVRSVEPSSTTTIASTQSEGTASTTLAILSPSFQAGATQSTLGRVRGSTSTLIE